MKRETLQRSGILAASAVFLAGSAALAALLVGDWHAYDVVTRWSLSLGAASLATLGVVTMLLGRPGGFTLRALKRFFIALIGTSVVLIGIAGLVLPILQGWLLIFLGLGILATEFAFARHILHKTRSSANTMARRAGLSERLRRRLHLELGEQPQQHPPDRADCEEHQQQK